MIVAKIHLPSLENSSLSFDRKRVFYSYTLYLCLSCLLHNTLTIMYICVAVMQFCTKMWNITCLLPVTKNYIYFFNCLFPVNYLEKSQFINEQFTLVCFRFLKCSLASVLLYDSNCLYNHWVLNLLVLYITNIYSILIHSTIDIFRPLIQMGIFYNCSVWFWGLLF